MAMQELPHGFPLVGATNATSAKGSPSGLVTGIGSRVHTLYANELKAAWLKQDKAKLEAMTLPQLSYSHSDARLEDKAKFIEGVMGRKATVKSLEFPEMTVQVVGNTAIVRHLWVSQTELEGKVTDTKIAVIQVWQKQDGGWKLLARASYRLPQQA